MKKRIAILHYASPPGVGGVESMIAHHARTLVSLDYPVRVISGQGEPFDERIETHIDPLFGSSDPDVLRIKTELDRGQVSPDFDILLGRMLAALETALIGCDVCIAHNIPTLHKNLPLTAALAQLHAAGNFRLIAWCNDLAWTNEQYQPELHPGYPWDLLRQVWPGTRYVTISEARREELSDLMGLAPGDIEVSFPGIDPASFFRWTPTTASLVSRLKLLDAAGLLLLPARLTRRKNISLALRVLAEIRAQSGQDFRLIVTGPPGPHNPANPGYLGELLTLRRDLVLEDAAHFLYACGDSPDMPLIPDDDTIADFYRLADALFFPSTQEGFGIPMLEAGLSGLPIFCANIPPLRGTGQSDATYFDPLHDSPNDIAVRLLTALTNSAQARLRVRVRHQFRWEGIVRDQIVPLLEEV